jgi:GntR family transcriptional regulator / MocR family aminotransferase
MRIPIDRESEVPIYRQIQQFISRQIESGVLKPGTRLPSTRDLAHSLDVSRIVVASAYADLEAQGLIYGRRGSGTFVAPLYPSAVGFKRDMLVTDWPLWQQELLSHSWDVSHQELDKLLALANRPDLISFAERIQPDPIWPVDDIRRALQVALREHDPGSALGQNNLAGYSPLRETIAQILALEGIQVFPDQVMITSGSQQALNLVAHVLLKPGDLVLVESPTYNVAIDLFRSMNVRLLSIPVDDQGMQVESIEANLGSNLPKLIYTIPTFHNPTGTCMSSQRRHELIILANRHNIPILEDDYVGNIRFEDRTEPALKSLDRVGGVIYAGTFSKLLMPSLRVGFLIASGPILNRLQAHKYVTDLVTSDLLQRALREFINLGRYHSHLRRVSLAYKQRRDAMAEALNKHLPSSHWVLPKGGGYIWLQLPSTFSSDEFFHFAIKEGVTFVPGSFFYPGQQSHSSLRLNYAINDPESIREGVRRLGVAFERFISSKGQRNENKQPNSL